jgi:hypothetical protein
MAVEPSMERLRTGTRHLDRDGMLVLLSDKGLVVTDVSVVYPATTALSSRQHVRQVWQPPLLHCPWSPTGAWDAVSAHPTRQGCLLCNSCV